MMETFGPRGCVVGPRKEFGVKDRRITGSAGDRDKNRCSTMETLRSMNVRSRETGAQRGRALRWTRGSLSSGYTFKTQGCAKT